MGTTSGAIAELSALIESVTRLTRNEDAGRAGEEVSHAQQDHYTIWPAKMAESGASRARGDFTAEDTIEIELVRQLKKNYYTALEVVLEDELAIARELYRRGNSVEYETRFVSTVRRRPDRNRGNVTALMTFSVRYTLDLNL